MKPDQPNNQGQTPSALPQYDFIMNTGNQPKKSKLGLPSGNSTKQRVLIVAGGAGILLIVGFIVMSLFGGSPSSKDNLTLLAQQQNEIVRIADAAQTAKTIRNINTLHAATSIGVVLQSDQQQTIALLAKKPSVKILSLKKSTKTDADLVTASQNNTYDETLLNTLQTQLVQYQQQLKKTYDASSSKKEKDALSAAYKNTGLLLTIPTK